MRTETLLLMALVLSGGCGPGELGVGNDPVSGSTTLPGDPDGESADGPSFAQCAATTVAAKPVYKPVDIVFTVDNTPSMLDEINQVRANLNAFSKSIMDSGIDVHIVLISCLPGECDNDKWHGVCIDPPLGAQGGCVGAGPYRDTNPPHFLHVNRRVESLKGLGRTVQTYAEWKSMIRPGSLRHFVAVSDDNDEWSGSSFNSALLALDPGLAGYRFHAIYSYKSKEAACALSKSEPCCTYAAPSGEGIVYRELVTVTGGVSGDLCLQSFAPVLKAVASSVVVGAKVDCSWKLPPAPAGQDLDPTEINVQLEVGSQTTLLGQVADAAACAAVKDGWYYDHPYKPTTVSACPQTCKALQGQAGVKVNIQLGCRTKIAAPE